MKSKSITPEICLIKSDIENCNLDISKLKQSIKERKIEMEQYKIKLKKLLSK